MTPASMSKRLLPRVSRSPAASRGSPGAGMRAALAGAAVDVLQRGPDVQARDEAVEHVDADVGGREAPQRRGRDDVLRLGAGPTTRAVASESR